MTATHRAPETREIIEIVETPVFSWDHAHLSRPEKWFAESDAAVDSAFFLFRAMSEGDFKADWHRAKSAAFIFAHGVELFLKAAIAAAAKPVEPIHGLEKLYNTYRNLYPAKRFAFNESMEEFVREDPAKPYYSFLKYPEKEAGRDWVGGSHIVIGTWKEEIGKFTSERSELKRHILEKFPPR